MLCWVANVVEAYNKEVRLGFKDCVIVLLRPSNGGGVDNVYKLTKGSSVNFFHVLHNLDKRTIFFVKMTMTPIAAILDCPLLFPAVL